MDNALARYMNPEGGLRDTWSDLPAPEYSNIDRSAPLLPDLMGIPDQVAMNEFLPFASGVADFLTPKPLAASRAFLEAVDRGRTQRDPFAHIGPLATLALEANIPVEGVGNALLSKLGPLSGDAMNYLPELMGILVGPKSKLWKSAPQVGQWPVPKPPSNVVGITKNLTPEQKWDRLSPRRQKEIEMKVSHEDEMFLDEYPTFGMSDKEVSEWADRVAAAPRDELIEFNRDFMRDPVEALKKHNVFSILFGGEPMTAEAIRAAKEESMASAQRSAQALIDSHNRTKSMFVRNGKWYDTPNTETYPQGAFSNLSDRSMQVDLPDEIVLAAKDGKFVRRSKSFDESMIEGGWEKLPNTWDE